ncbi:response regulator transcription factor [Tautonia sp. JC769]|uniref:response regulator transcription factor n=1 Tax=Tautonia sp. JC769 TaxID=3232135 RepID=UPI003459D422
MTKITILVVDDHHLFRAGVRAILDGIEDLWVCGDVSSAEEALPRLEAHRPDILLTDISMTGMTGLELADRVRRNFPGTRTIILSMHATKEYAERAFRAGVAGFLVKDAAVHEVELAIRTVARGETYLSPAISSHLISNYAKRPDLDEPAPIRLTARQREVLKLIAEGLTTKAIARRLNISVKTADTHRTQLMERLDLHDIASLVRYAIRVGLVTPDE